MSRRWILMLCGLATATVAAAGAGEMPRKAATYHAALLKRPESVALFQRFRDAWLEERPAAELEQELLSRAEAGEAGAWAVLARERLMEGKEAEAADAFGKALAADPDAAWLHLEQAKLLLAEKDFPAAEKEAVAVAEGSPQRAEALKLAGLACLRDERVEEALAHWAAAVKAGAGDKALLEELTELTRREGRLDLALDFCGQWRDATEDPYAKAMAMLQHASLTIDAQRLEEGLKELGEVLGSSGDGSWLEREVLARAMRIYEKQEDPQGWAAKLREWSERSPTRLGVRRALATALADSGETDEALEVLAEVLKRQPGDREVRWQRVDLLKKGFKIEEAFEECGMLAAEEKTEAAGLLRAELAFRLEKTDEVKKALDGVLARVDPARAVTLVDLYARYGLPEESERRWREMAGGEQGGQALRELARFLAASGRDDDELDVWRMLGKREFAADRIEAAQALAGAGRGEEARALLDQDHGRFTADPAHGIARADLALRQGRLDDARDLYRAVAKRARQPDEMGVALRGWLKAVAGREAQELPALGDDTADRCLRAAALARSGGELPAVKAGDELERSIRLLLLRELGRWREVVALLEQGPQGGVTILRELAEAKRAAGDGAGALVAAKAWRDRMPEQPEAWLKEAELLSEIGRGPEAEVLLRRAVAKFEDDENVAGRLFSFLAENDGGEALDYAWRRYDRGGDKAGRWMQEIVRLSRQRERLDELEEKFSERARRNPTSPLPLLALASCAEVRENSSSQIELLRRAAVIAPRDPSILHALAAAEESAGLGREALQRYEQLMRLAPGAAATREWARAKIRQGEVAEGVRELLALGAGAGTGTRELEGSAAEVALGGRMDEAIQLLEAVPRGNFDARLHYLAAFLAEVNGRGREAFNHYLAVLAEPDDPAEKPAPDEEDRPLDRRNLLDAAQRIGDSAEPGTLQDFAMPDSLREAKKASAGSLLRIGVAESDEEEVWSQAVAAVPLLSIAPVRDWRQAVEFYNGEAQGGWWQFLMLHPANPLGPELLYEEELENARGGGDLETNSYAPRRLKGALAGGRIAMRPEVRLGLFADLPEIPDEAVEAVIRLEREQWRNPAVPQACLAILKNLLWSEELRPPSGPSSLEKIDRILAVMADAGFTGRSARDLGYCQGRRALLAGDANAAMGPLAIAVEEGPEEDRSSLTAYHQLENECGNAFHRWQEGKGDGEKEQLVAQATPPRLRCMLAMVATPERALERIAKELDALPPTGAELLRRDLIRLRWDAQYGREATAARRQDLEKVAADESDLRLAADAAQRLIAQEDPLKTGKSAAARFEELRKRLEAGDASDRRYLTWLIPAKGDFDPFAPARGGIAASATAARWGMKTSYQASARDTTDVGRMIEELLESEDRPQAMARAAGLLEALALHPTVDSDQLANIVAVLQSEEMSGEAMAQIPVPAEAGLGRYVGLLKLFDAAGAKEKGDQVIEELHRRWPRELQWTLRLAFRTGDPARAMALFDEAAQAPDFHPVLLNELSRDSSAGSGEKQSGNVARLTRLIEWAETSQKPKQWLGSLMLGLVGGEWLDPLSGGKDESQVSQRVLFRRFQAVAMKDPQAAELGFAAVFDAKLDPEEVLEETARQALLSGAYGAAGEPVFDLNGSPFGTEAPRALTYLIGAARAKGDENVFPATFRERLKEADPAFAEWLGGLLAMRDAKDLPAGERNLTWALSWSETARREAGVLRTCQLAGREEYLLSVFREKGSAPEGESIKRVIRASLVDALRDGKVAEKVNALLEAHSGPREKWPALVVDGRVALAAAGKVLLQSASDAEDGALLLPTLMESLRDSRVPIDGDALFGQLGGQWRKSWKEPEKAADARVPVELDAHGWIHLGGWRLERQAATGGTARYEWGAPNVLRIAAPFARQPEFRQRLEKDPQARLADLLAAVGGLAGVSAGDEEVNSLRSRVVRQLAPALQSEPAEVQEEVFGQLIGQMTAADLPALPPAAAALLEKRLKAAQDRRLADAQRRYQAMQGRRWNAGELGKVVAEVGADDPGMAQKMVDEWLAGARNRVNRNDLRLFVGALIDRSPERLAELFTHLTMADRVVKERWAELAGQGSALERVWSKLGSASLADPEFWRSAAQLSPACQARLFAAGWWPMLRCKVTDPALKEKLLKAAGDGAIVRNACAWALVAQGIQGGRQVTVEGAPLLEYLRALKQAGLGPEEMLEVLGIAYSVLCYVDNAGELMNETPLLLAGVKRLDPHSTEPILAGIRNCWAQRGALRQGSPPDAAGRAAAHPTETIALLNFLISSSREEGPARSFGGDLARIVILCDDPGLLQRWLACQGERLRENFPPIYALDRMDGLQQALSLKPPWGDQVNRYGMRFTREMEGEVAKLAADDSPGQRHLALCLSLFGDATGADAPREPRARRLERWSEDFEKRRERMTPDERMAWILLLGRERRAMWGHREELDEFAAGGFEEKFQALMDSSSPSPDDEIRFDLTLAAACSQWHAGDPAGFEALAAALKKKSARKTAFRLGAYRLQMLLVSAWIATDAAGGHLPEASREAIRRLAKSLAEDPGDTGPGGAFSLLCLAADSPEKVLQLARALGGAMDPFRNRFNSWDDPSWPLFMVFEFSEAEDIQRLLRAARRVSVLHPAASEEWGVAADDSDQLPDTEILAPLEEPQVRAAIPPARAIRWMEMAKSATPETLAMLAKFRQERDKDFTAKLPEEWREAFAALEKKSSGAPVKEAPPPP